MNEERRAIKKKKEEKNPCESSAKMNDKSKVNDFTMYSYKMVRYSSQHHIHDYIMYILPNHKWIATTIDIKRACSRIYTHTHEKKKWKRFRNWQIHSLTVRLHFNTSHTHTIFIRFGEQQQWTAPFICILFFAGFLNKRTTSVSILPQQIHMHKTLSVFFGRFNSFLCCCELIWIVVAVRFYLLCELLLLARCLTILYGHMPCVMSDNVFLTNKKKCYLI